MFRHLELLFIWALNVERNGKVDRRQTLESGCREQDRSLLIRCLNGMEGMGQ